MKLETVFAKLVEARTDQVVIATMTSGYEWPRQSRSDRDFCYIAPMGSAGPLGLGLALARPDLRVWVLDGEGSLMMNLGALVTIGAEAPNNLVHLVMNNGVYSITGGQPVVGRGVASLAAIASASGIPTARTITTTEELQDFVLRDLHANKSGPVFADVHVEAAYDRTIVSQYTHSDQAKKTQGGPGFHNLRSLLLNT